MKNVFLVCIITILFTSLYLNVSAQDGAEGLIYEDFNKIAKEYDELGLVLEEGTYDYPKNAGRIFEKIINLLFNELKSSMKMFIVILIVSMLLSVLKAFSVKQSFSDVAEYGIYCLSGMLILAGFKSINHICVSGIDNLSDFMDIAVPAYVTVLSACGYTTTALSVQSLFMVISVILTKVIKLLICPLLFCCGLVAVVGGVSGAVDLTGVIKLISNTVKYTLGIIMTIFAGVLAFSGFASSASDSLALQTAKFAVANFVPVVGGCLSSALNSLKQSSLILKNGMGYVGFLVMLSLGLIPIVKVLASVFSIRLSASMAHLFGESKLSHMLDSVCNVIVTMGALLVLVSVIFILIIGVISAVG